MSDEEMSDEELLKNLTAALKQDMETSGLKAQVEGMLKVMKEADSRKAEMDDLTKSNPPGEGVTFSEEEKWQAAFIVAAMENAGASRKDIAEAIQNSEPSSKGGIDSSKEDPME